MGRRDGLVHARVARERRREQQHSSSANSPNKGGQKASKNGPQNSGSKNGNKGNNDNGKESSSSKDNNNNKNNNKNNKSSSSSSPPRKNHGGGASKQKQSSPSTKQVQGKPTTHTKVVNGKTKTMTSTPRSTISSHSASSDDTPPQSTMTNLLPPSSSPSSSSNPFATAGPPGYSNSPATSSSGTHLSGGAIAGIAVGAAVFVLLLALITGLIARWLTKKNEPEQKPVDYSSTAQHDSSSRGRSDYGAYGPSMAQASYAPYDGTNAPQSVYADNNMYAVPATAQQTYTHSNMSDDLQQTPSDERKRSVELVPATQEPIAALERDNDTFSSGYSDYAYQYQPTTAQDADAALEGNPRQFGSPPRRRFTRDDPYSSELYSQPGARNLLSRSTANDMYMEVPDMHSTSASERTGDEAAAAEANAEPDVVDEAKAGADELPSARWRRTAHPRRAERHAY